MIACQGLNNSTRAKGFTLVELIIAIAIVAILVAIAIPSYSIYIRKAHRSVAKAFISEVSQRQESFAIDHKQYASTLAQLGYGAGGNFINTEGVVQSGSTGAIYSIAMGAACNGTSVAATTNTLFVTATPQDAKELAGCGFLCINSAGKRTSAGDTKECWGR